MWVHPPNQILSVSITLLWGTQLVLVEEKLSLTAIDLPQSLTVMKPESSDLKTLDLILGRPQLLDNEFT